MPVPVWQLLVGKYHFEEAGLKKDVDLNADGTARYQVNTGRAVGFWAVRDNRLQIYDKPGPVMLEHAGRPDATGASTCASSPSCRMVRPLKALVSRGQTPPGFTT